MELAVFPRLPDGRQGHKYPGHLCRSLGDICHWVVYCAKWWRGWSQASWSAAVWNGFILTAMRVIIQPAHHGVNGFHQP